MAFMSTVPSLSITDSTDSNNSDNNDDENSKCSDSISSNSSNELVPTLIAPQRFPTLADALCCEAATIPFI